MYSAGGLLVLILDVYVLLNLLKTSAEPSTKVLWIVLILVLPLVGAILYLLLGPGKRIV